MEDRPTHTYAGTCPECGVLCASRVDWGDKKDIAAGVAEFIADGLTVERITMAELRGQFGSCKCGQQRLL